MYETVFDLPRRPFAATPDPDCFFAAPCAAQAVGRLQRAAVRAEGIGVLIGPHGCGKTLVARRLMLELGRGFRTALLASARFESPAALLQTILFELDQPYRGLSEHELRFRLIECLSQDSRRTNRAGGLVLVVDEGHALTPALVEELRLIGDLAHNGYSLVRLTIAGSESLEELLARPELAAFQQRIAVRVYLEPFTLEETSAYLRYRLDWAGAKSEGLFSREAIERLHALSEGVPRRTGQIADQTLLLAAHGHTVPIAPELIDEAWSSLEQIPAQWTGAVSEQGESGEPAVVEFGSGDDDLGWDAEDHEPDGGGSANSVTCAVPDARPDGKRVGVCSEEVGNSASIDQPAAQPASADEELVIDPVAALDARRTKPIRPFVCHDPAEVFFRRNSRTGTVPLQAVEKKWTPAGAQESENEGEITTASDGDLDGGLAACQIEFERLILPVRDDLESEEERDLIVVTDTGQPPASTAKVVPKPGYRNLFKKLRQD